MKTRCRKSDLRNQAVQLGTCRTCIVKRFHCVIAIRQSAILVSLNGIRLALPKPLTPGPSPAKPGEGRKKRRSPRCITAGFVFFWILVPTLPRGNAVVATLLRRQPQSKKRVTGHRLPPRERREQYVPTRERGNEKNKSLTALPFRVK